MPRHSISVSLVALSAGLAAAVALPALAADQTVTATSSNDFTPADVTVDQGEKVTWNNDGGGAHNVRFDDSSFEQPAEPDTSDWTVEHTFNTAGTFRYYCEEHGGPGGSGMSGTVTVRATGTGPPPPGPGPGPGPGPPSPGPAPGAAPPVVSRFSMTRTRFAVGRGATARSARRIKRGSAFLFRLSEQARVRIAISRAVKDRAGRRRYTQKGTLVRRDLKSGNNTVRFSGRIGKRALPAGPYRATISATDADGEKSRPKRTSFRVVAA
jgi:plastocyanin